MLKKVSLITAIAILLACFVSLNSQDTFSYGKKSYYVYNRSSGAQITTQKPFLAVNVVGETVVLSASEFNVQKLLLEKKANVLFEEKLGEELTIYYCYSPKIKRQKTVKGERVNMQIAIRGAVVTIGSPVIYGSY